MSRLSEVRFLTSVASAAQFPVDAGAEVAFAGRSNAGKSSAINAITKRRGLARTSKTPGRTRLLNYFELSPMKRLVDLPGYGYAGVTASERAAWLPLLETLRERSSLTGLFLIVDSRRGRSGTSHGFGAARQPRYGAAVLGAPRLRSRRGASDVDRLAFDGAAGRDWAIKNPGGVNRRGRLTRHRSHEPGLPAQGGKRGVRCTR